MLNNLAAWVVLFMLAWSLLPTPLVAQGFAHQPQIEGTTVMDDYNNVIEFWFAHPTQWFAKDPRFDEQIRQLFMSTYEKARTGELATWESQPQSMLALIIVLDQFPRNMFRGSKQAFSTDEPAQRLTKKAINLGFDQALDKDEHRHFLYMPLMHSEHLPDQELSLKVFATLQDKETLQYAQAHRDIIAKFGRFPHRNIILERQSTSAEVEFLKLPGSSF